MNNKAGYPEPQSGQGLRHVSAFDKGELLRNVHITGMAEHAESLSQDDFFTTAWREWFAAAARLARSLAEDGR